MAIYGKLTKSRSTLSEIPLYSTNTGSVDLTAINDKYDYHIQRLVNLLPADQKFFTDQYGVTQNIINHVTLYEDDVISSQVETVRDTLMAATAMIRRFIKRAEAAFQMSLEADSGFSAEDVTDDVVIYDVPPVLEKDIFVPIPDEWFHNPKWLESEIADQIQENLQTIWDFSNWVMDMGTLRDYGAVYEPYPIDSLQNIYNNRYFGSEREYENVDIRSKLVDSIPNIVESDFFRNASTAPTNSVRTIPEATIDNFTFALSPNNSAKSVSDYNSLQIDTPIRSNYFTTPLTAMAAPAALAKKPLSYSGAGQQKPLSGGGNYGQFNNRLGVGVKISGNSALFQSVQSVQQVKVEGGAVKSVLVRRQMPISNTDQAGNSLTKFRGDQLTANVATLISSDGQQKIMNEPNLNQNVAAYNGKIKLYKSKRKITDREERTIARYSISANGTQTTTVFRNAVNLNGFTTIGSLGVEKFEGLGYDEWCIGAGSTMFLMNLEQDIGYNSWDSGTAYENGGIETFDDGWSVGFSPYSRKGESSAYSEDLTSLITGSDIFKTTYPYLQGTLRVYLNGMEQIKGITFIEASSQTFQMSEVPVATDTLSVSYERFYGTQDEGDFKKSPQEQYEEELRKQGGNSLILRGAASDRY